MIVRDERGEKKEWETVVCLTSSLMRENEANGILDKENRRGAMRGGVRGRIALSGIFTGIRDGIVACPVPMQS